MGDRYDVFISFKFTDQTGRPTADFALAQKIYDFLSSRGVAVFFSSVSLEHLGVAAYKEEIDRALDAAAVLVAVGTSEEHLESKWVKYEWDSFANEILSGRKKHGRVFVYVSAMETGQLPYALRQSQCFIHGEGSLDALHRFIANALAEVRQSDARLARPSHEVVEQQRTISHPADEAVVPDPNCDLQRSLSHRVPASTNCLLSEWDGLANSRLLPWRWASNWLPLGFFAAAVVAVLLSIFSHADFMGLRITGPGATTPVYVLYGYVAELNAGPFYMIVAPIFAWLSCRFLMLADDAIRALPLRFSTPSVPLTRSQSEAEQRAAIDAIAARNRRWGKVYLLAPAIALLLVYPPETHSLLDARRGTLASDADYQPVVMGFVQTPYFSRWADHAAAPGAIHYGDEVSEIRRARETNATISPFPAGGLHGTRAAAFWVFLFWALALEAVFTTLVIWILLKVLRVLWLLYKMLPRTPHEVQGAPRRPDGWPEIDPDFSDSNRRYGLTPLDEVYRAMFALIIVLGIALVLNLGTNMAKGTAVQQGGNAFDLVGQFVVRVLPYIMWALFFVMPMWIYRTRLRDARQARVRDLAARIRAATAAHEPTGEFEDVLGRVLKQTTWPAGDYAFYILCMLATTLLVVLPFSMYRVPLLTGAHESSGVANTIIDITDFLRGIISRLYGC